MKFSGRILGCAVLPTTVLSTTCNAIDNLFLVDADRDELVDVLPSSLFYPDIGCNEINVEATLDCGGASSESVQMWFDYLDDPSGFTCENNAPYTVFGNNRRPEPGVYQVRAVPFTEPDCTGEAGSFYFANLTIESCPQQDNILYRLWKAGGPGDAEFQQNLTDGASFCEFSYEVNIEALLSDDNCCVDRVHMELHGPHDHSNTEGAFPYFLFGNIGNDVEGETLRPGTYTLTTTVKDMFGIESGIFSINFEVLFCRTWRWTCGDVAR
jgi:hypothetical protein